MKIPLAHLRSVVAFLVLSLPFTGMVGRVLAQPPGTPGSRTPTNSAGTAAAGNPNGSFYDYSTPGEFPIEINIWGAVLRPGKYRVPQSTKLIQLISLAGGPTERARLEEIRVLHDLTVDSTIKDPVTIFNFEEYQRTGDVRLNPLLYANDTVILPNNSFSTFMEILGVVRDIATVVSSIIGLYVLFRNQSK